MHKLTASLLGHTELWTTSAVLPIERVHRAMPMPMTNTPSENKKQIINFLGIKHASELINVAIYVVQKLGSTGVSAHLHMLIRASFSMSRGTTRKSPSTLWAEYKHVLRGGSTTTKTESKGESAGAQVYSQDSTNCNDNVDDNTL